MKDIKQFQSRVDLWVGRYEDTKNEAILFYSEKNQRLRWVYGDTQHCGTCAALNGIVAFASEWETAGVQPQSPPNDLLECGGWKCQCYLEPTDDRRSPDALTRIMDAITAGSIGKSFKGGPGSGNFGHEGRPGEVGGSGPGGGVSEKTAEDVSEYLSFSYYPVNEYLRGNDSKYEDMYSGEREKETKDIVDSLDKAIEEHGEEYTGIAYRGSGHVVDGVDAGFVSATFDKDKAAEYAHPYIIEYHLHDVPSLDVEKFMEKSGKEYKTPEEKELLIGRGMTFSPRPGQSESVVIVDVYK